MLYYTNVPINHVMISQMAKQLDISIFEGTIIEIRFVETGFMHQWYGISLNPPVKC